MLITSLQNPRIKQVLKLRTSRARKLRGLTLIDGSREILTAFRSGADLQEIFVCPRFFDQHAYGFLLRQAAVKRIPVHEVSPRIYAKLSFGDREDGLVAVCHPRRWQLNDCDFSRISLCLILEGIEKPGNLGAILRTADAAGVQAMLVTETKTDIYHPNVIRASMGTVFRVPAVICGNLEAHKLLQENGLQIIATVCQADTVYTDIRFLDPTAIVLGSEEKGLSRFWTTHADWQVKIPMQGSADSLNVSVSAALLVYEALRQRRITASA